MVTNMKLALTNVPFTFNSAYLTQKWLRFMSQIIPNRSKIIQLLFFKSCILVNLLKTEVLNSH